MNSHLSDVITDEKKKEFERLLELAEYDLDYSDLNQHLGDLTRLAAKVAGVPMSAINIIDAVSQWTVARHGTDLSYMPRENSVCNYTIKGDSPLEIKNLLEDNRVNEQEYVLSGDQLRYYYGIPLKTEAGNNLGALCVLDRKARELSPEKIELLTIIADEITGRLRTMKKLKDLHGKVNEADDRIKKTSHDIRGPIAGIMQLSKIIKDEGDKNSLENVLELIDLIYKGSRSLLDLADEILSDDPALKSYTPENRMHISVELFSKKLKELYSVQSASKGIQFSVKTEPDETGIQFPARKKLQITGNLISNAIKFTPSGGTVRTELSVIPDMQHFKLRIKVKDTGVGISDERIKLILTGEALSTSGTTGERGFGFGLPLVIHLVESLNGKIEINSTVGEGTEFIVEIPV